MSTEIKARLDSIGLGHHYDEAALSWSPVFMRKDELEKIVSFASWISPMTDESDEDHPLWLVNEQIKGLLEGDGADEDHKNVLALLAMTGLPETTIARIHRAIVCAEVTPK